MRIKKGTAAQIMSKNDSADDSADTVNSLYPEIQVMFDEFPRYRKEILPSKYWKELNRKNLRQLADMAGCRACRLRG